MKGLYETDVVNEIVLANWLVYINKFIILSNSNWKISIYLISYIHIIVALWRIVTKVLYCVKLVYFSLDVCAFWVYFLPHMVLQERSVTTI